MCKLTNLLHPIATAPSAAHVTESFQRRSILAEAGGEPFARRSGHGVATQKPTQRMPSDCRRGHSAPCRRRATFRNVGAGSIPFALIQCRLGDHRLESWMSIVAKDPIRGQRPPTITTFISRDPTFTGENANHLSFSRRRTVQCRLARSLFSGTSPPLVHSLEVS